MILGFKDQFVPFVLDGTKTHTIRAGNRWKAGMRADLYARPRQNGMRLLFRANVAKVETIEIMCFPDERPDGWPSAKVAPLFAKTKIAIDGLVLSDDEAEAFAWRDGFRGGAKYSRLPRDRYFSQMLKFWQEQHGFGSRNIRFEGQLIHWDYANRVTAEQDARRKAIARQHPHEYIDIHGEYR